MKRKQLQFQKSFGVAIGNQRSQAAEMVLRPGDSEGDGSNRHRGPDQWLFVVNWPSNRQWASVSPAGRNLLLLIERNDTHHIESTSRDKPLATLNFYVPPAYTPDGEELPAGKRH